VILVVLPTMVRSEESLNVTPGTLDGVSVVCGVRIDERNAVAHGAVRVTLRLYIPIPARQSLISVVAGSIQAWITSVSAWTVLSGTATNVLPDPRSTPPNTRRVSPMVFSPTELAFVDLNGLVRTVDLLRAALKVYQ
jgi:hypothetical protein